MHPQTEAPGDPPLGTATLRRALGLPLLTLYGLGVTVGAGVYVLIGLTVANAGGLAWLSFLIAGCVAGLTAFSYAELATRFPVSAGEAVFVQEGLRLPPLSFAIGLLTASAGLISAAAISVGAAGYLGSLTALPVPVLILGIVLLMGVIAGWGILQSVVVAAVITVIEILGLVLVIIYGFAFATPDGLPADTLLSLPPTSAFGGLAVASLLAFFAFVGFEDMVNVAEEVENPDRTLPLAIIITLVTAIVLYVATCLAALVAVPIEVLATSDKPLLEVFANAAPGLQNGFAMLAGLATVNGVLIQIIMAARVLFGMSSRGQLPRAMSQVSERTKTPLVATGVATLCVLALSLFLPIGALAEWTSVIVLTIFATVNAALIALKRRETVRGTHFTVPVVVPWLGVVTSVALLGATLV